MDDIPAADQALDPRPDVFLVHGTDLSWQSIALCGAYNKNDGVSDIREVHRFSNTLNAHSFMLTPLHVEHRTDHRNAR